MNYPKSGQEAKAYGARGAAKSTLGQVYRIEGETVTMQGIAKRLGVSLSAARDRLRRLKGASGAVTWGRLGGA
jgi:ribosomal protein S25